MLEEINKIFLESSSIILSSQELSKNIEVSIHEIVECFKRGNKLVIFGNGGSAADAQHIAAELIGRFEKDRQSLPALALTTDSSIITSLANDYNFEFIFSRQCESLIKEGDIAIGISTSGNSKNVINGLITCKKIGAKCIGLLGNSGGIIKNHTDVAIIVDSENTGRIQEVHRVIYHIICKLVEKEMANN